MPRHWAMCVVLTDIALMNPDLGMMYVQATVKEFSVVNVCLVTAKYLELGIVYQTLTATMLHGLYL